MEVLPPERLRWHRVAALIARNRGAARQGQETSTLWTTSAVTRALQEFIARREQRHIAELFGKLEWDASLDYKAERSRTR